MKSCFFIGHRDAPDAVLAHLTVTLERLIVEESVGFFYVGQYGSFDRLAGLAVKQLKQQYPFITLMLVLPYHPADRPVPTPPGFDGTYYPEGMENVPKRYAIVKANKQIVNNSDWLIAYVRHPASNARNLLEYMLTSVSYILRHFYSTVNSVRSQEYTTELSRIPDSHL